MHELIHLSILLQANAKGDSVQDGIVMALISFAVIFFLSISGKVQMGFYVPGFPTPLRRSRKRILREKFAYYNNLTPENQQRFERKVQEFIYRKEFIPRQIPTVTEEMKTLIAACAIQLTFGLPKIFFAHFKRIIVYPTNYYSTINKQYHKGEVNPRLRAIVLSWQHFIDGYFNPQDGLNLGLHEMTHALHLENRIRNEEFDFFDKEALLNWKVLADIEIEIIKSEPNHFFRQYASTNREEFLAVAVENFFEKSAEFKAELPELYETLAVLLNQDPLHN